MARISTIEELEALYGTPSEASIAKVASKVTAQYRALIEASPFVALATAGPDGLDCTPRGELGGVVRIHDEHTLHMPDRRGNNRIDSLRNIVCDPRVGLLLLLPGIGSTLRINGTAHISADAQLLQSFDMAGKLPRSVVVIEIAEIYFQCARAVVRAGLWDSVNHLDPKTIPTPGEILAAQTQNRFDGKEYDHAWPKRAADSLW